MDEWESVRQKIRELQGSFLNSSPEVRSTLDTVSVADFWKRRYEEEKQLWEDKLAAKEKEQMKTEQQFVQDEQGIRELNFKIKGLEEKLSSEKMIWEERSKLKLLEAELEKRKVEWDAKIRTLENENEQLRSKIRRGAESSEEETRRRQQMESEKLRMEEELKNLQKQIQAMTLQEQQKLQQMATDKQALQKQLEELQATKNEGKGRSAEIEKEMTLLAAERDRQLAMIAEREKEQFEAFEDLARGFAHKVRNYLGIMSGTLQLCMTNFKMEEELKKQVTLVDQNAQDMLKSIEEFLSLAKIPEMSLQNSAINELLSNVLFSLEDAARSQNIRLEKKFSDSLPMATMDGKLLSEAFKQLLHNSIEASTAGSAVTVSSNFESPSNKIVLRIIDTGKGISENHLKKVFQPYFTTKKGKKGLGLSIAKRAIDLHHGSLSVFSAKNQGTTVTVQLPVRKNP